MPSLTNKQLELAIIALKTQLDHANQQILNNIYLTEYLFATLNELITKVEGASGLLITDEKYLAYVEKRSEELMTAHQEELLKGTAALDDKLLDWTK